MDRSTPIRLITETVGKDEYGINTTTVTSRTVFAQVDSVTRAEFHDAGRNGLNPQYRFTMFAYDYEGEKIVEYNGLQYSVYRTFMKRNDELELYVERQGGSNGSS